MLGEKSYARLEDIPEKVEIVDIFRRSEYVPDVVESAIRIGAKAIWMQEGVIHADAAEKARRAGLFVVMDLCILKEHAKRFRMKGIGALRRECRGWVNREIARDAQQADVTAIWRVMKIAIHQIAHRCGKIPVRKAYPH